MESLLNKCNSMHRRSGSNKENQAPTGCNLRLYKNHSAGPIGIPFKPKNSNHINFHNGLNLLRNQANQLDHHKLTVNNGFNLNNGLNNGFNRKSNNNFYQAAKLSDENSMNHLNILTSSMNSRCSNISKLQSYQPHMNQQSQINQQQINQQSQINQLSLSTSTNSSSSQNKLSDLYKSQYSGSSSSLLSYGSSNDNSSDRRFLPPPPKQNIMYHEQRYKTELCRAYEEQKNCVYGDRCMFAHGQWELKQSISKHPKYKTQKCVAFEEGLCMFGTRCSFLHEKIGSAEEIVDSMLQLNQLNKEKFSIPSQPTIKQTSTNLDTIDEQSDFLTKAIGDIEKRTQFLSSFKSDSLFDLSTIKPEFNFHPKSFNNALGNIIRLDNINEQVEKCKLLPDLTSLLVDDHANSNTLFFNDDSSSCSSRLPIFEKISSTPLQSSINESISSNDKMDLIDNLNSSNNSSKSNSTIKSNDTTDSTVSSVGANSISCESTISINSSDLKLMDFDIDSFI